MKALLLTAAAAALTLAVGVEVGNGQEKAMTPLTGKMKGIDGKDIDLAALKGKVVLVVNVASRCGYTNQYKGMQALFEQYSKDGLVVLGVPSNQFGAQEPGTEEDIQKFCSANYKVTFPMTAKVDVKGPSKVDLYKALTTATVRDGKTEEVGWNFEKFLIGRDGRVVARFKSAVAPESNELQTAVRTELAKK
ncbi:glutathione peroxidase [Urbifossiella limnaea]|uniref:Glutathione peroxidase n=1 Tax=Urbifossiella limnaea TaxID=2528023 RepID=A0A517XUP6_9BACT|nr:glutathione peroxidase [Urbifossiella limnaea]QDU21223.1 Hydroperoxy fatty acid reductase gpx2 [Urbifossiella limnaea]